MNGACVRTTDLPIHPSTSGCSARLMCFAGTSLTRPPHQQSSRRRRLALRRRVWTAGPARFRCRLKHTSLSAQANERIVRMCDPYHGFRQADRASLLLGQPVLNRSGQQQRLRRVVRTIGPSHERRNCLDSTDQPRQLLRRSAAQTPSGRRTNTPQQPLRVNAARRDRTQRPPCLPVVANCRGS